LHSEFPLLLTEAGQSQLFSGDAGSQSSAVCEDERGIIMTFKHRKSAAAFTLVEVMTSILIVTIVVTGGSYLFIAGRNQVKLQKHYRSATQLAAQKLEELKAGPYVNISIGSSSDSNTLDGATYTRDVNTVDNGTYKQVSVNVHWQEGLHGQFTRNVSLVTLIAP
jgi:Tfp pilus assembly protein PilV